MFYIHRRRSYLLAPVVFEKPYTTCCTDPKLSFITPEKTIDLIFFRNSAYQPAAIILFFIVVLFDRIYTVPVTVPDLPVFYLLHSEVKFTNDGICIAG